MPYIVTDKIRFLSNATKILSSSLDTNTTLKSIADLSVNNIADFCTIDLMDKNRKMQRVAAQASNSKDKILAQKMFDFPADPKSKRGIYQAARTGKTILVSKVTENWISTATRIPEEREIGDKLHLSSFIFAPLKSRNKVIGVMTLISNKPNFSYSKDDELLVEELANRAGIAVDKARLFSESQEAIHNRDLFISMASHELKTPITTMYIYTQLLKNKVNKGEPFDIEWINNLLYEMARLTKLVDELLQVSQIKTGNFRYEFEELEVLDIVKKAINSFKVSHKKSKVTFRNNAGKSDIRLVGDPNKLMQVIINLLDNSAKHNVWEKPIHLTLSSNGKKAFITVEDNGTGISKEDLGRIFDEFYKGKGHTKSGMGLGLYIIKKIIDKHPGKTKVIATNKEFCDAVKSIFINAGFVVSGIYPLSLCLELAPELQSSMDLNLVINKVPDLKDFNLMPVPEVAINAPENGKPNKMRLYLMIGVMVFLGIVMVFLLYRNILSPQRSKRSNVLPTVMPVIKKAEVVAPASSSATLESSASGEISVTRIPTSSR